MPDPFAIGWQRHMRGLERIVDTGVGLSWGIGKALFYGDAGTSLSKPISLANTLPLTPAQVLQSVMRTIAEQFLDKRVSMAVSDGAGTVAMTPKTLETDVNSMGLARGQFASINMTADKLVWRSGGRTVNVDHLSVDCHDIRLRTSFTPSLVFGTINVVVTMSARELRALILEQQPHITVDIGADGVLRASWSRMQRLGHVVVDADVDGDGNILLTASKLHFASLSVSLRRWLKPRLVEVPQLPWKMRLMSLETEGQRLRLRGLSEQAEGRISTVPVTELLTLVRAGVRVL